MREMDEAGDMMMHGDANAVSVQPGENEQLMWVHHTGSVEVGVVVADRARPRRQGSLDALGHELG